MPDRATFETLARPDDVPGQLGAEEMKFLIIGVDTDAPELYFLNTNGVLVPLRLRDARRSRSASALGEFNAQTYFRDDR